MMRAVLLLVAATPAVAVGNLLQNGGFESGALTPWGGGSYASVAPSAARTGFFGARVMSGGDVTQVVPTEAGREYKLLAWVRIVAETGSDWGGFTFSLTDWGWESMGQTPWLTQAVRGDGWFKVVVPFRAMSGLTRVHFGYFGGPARQMTAFVDDVAVIARGANAPPTLSASLAPLSFAALPATQSFSALADDTDGAVVRAVWDFGDGERSLEATGTRRVATAGAHTATLTVADDDGATASQTFSWSAFDPSHPSLVVASPADGETMVASPSVVFSGATSGSLVTAATDRAYDASVTGGASWQIPVRLAPGLNRVLIQTRGAAGRLAVVERLVRYVPPEPLAITGLSESATTVRRFEPVEITFDLANSAATDPAFPWDPAAPRGVPADGVTVDALFSQDGFRSVLRRPAFLQQRYARSMAGGEERLIPSGVPAWTVRFAPPREGVWSYKIVATESKGGATSAVRSFTAAAAAPGDHGPVGRCKSDSRYFVHADGTPFLGVGRGIGFSAEAYSYDAGAKFAAIGAGATNLARWWIGGHVWGSAWQPWSSRTLGSGGYLPNTGHVLDRAYGDGLASLRLDAANPLMWQGFMSGHAGLVAGRTYRVRVRWKTEGITGPANLGQPYGACIKFVSWPEPGQTGALPALVGHVAGDTPWHVATGEFIANTSLLPNLAVILENAAQGAVYLDEIAVHEVLPGAVLGPQLLRSPRANSHLTFDPRRGAGLDEVLRGAMAIGLHLKLVISEKDEWLVNHLGPEGLPERYGAQFDNGPGSAGYWLHRAYWRHLSARLGAYRSVFGWELVNEAAPGPGDHFRLTAELARFAQADGNPHLASTSTWATLAPDAWLHPESASIDHTDFHCYVMHGWLEPRAELLRDTARFYDAYSRASRSANFGKPAIWGEMGLDSDSTDNQEPLLALDAQGVWLHKMIWAGCGPGGVIPLYWYTDNIERFGLDRLYAPWRRFMEGIPLANGRYEDAMAVCTGTGLRAFGQKDAVGLRAHLWIDNARHTWWNVVNGIAMPPAAGTVRVKIGKPGSPVWVSWVSTSTGQVTRVDRSRVDSGGAVTVSVSGLATDVAVRIEPQGLSSRYIVP